MCSARHSGKQNAMENLRLGISCFIISICMCNVILCSGISWKEYNMPDKKFSEYGCIPSKTVVGSWKVSNVLTCARMCDVTEKCLGYWYQPGTHQCFALSGNPYEACVWTRNAGPYKWYYPKQRQIWSEYKAIQRENSYYFLLENHKNMLYRTFQLTVDHCKSKNATPVQPETPSENKFLKELALLTGLGFWVGITDMREEGTWEIWSSGQALSYSDWYQGDMSKYYPAKDNQAMNCAAYMIMENAKWINLPCDGVFSFASIPLCEKRIEE